MNFKNASVVAAGTVLGSGVLGLFLRWQPAALGAQEPKAANPPLQTGRFQMSGIPGHMYVIDAATGQVWERFDTPNSGSSSSNSLDPKIKVQP